MRKFFVVLICFVLLAGCGGGSSGSGGSADSDNPVNNVPNISPVAQIVSPDEGSSFVFGSGIEFSGIGTDDEDGELNDESLVWTSNMDGDIGTGSSVLSDGLSMGTHLITLTVIDSEGSEGMDTIAIAITGIIPDTGQTTSYTDTFGEDSDYTINPQSYTKLDEAGNELDDSAADWAMVRDNVTQLIWEVKTVDSGIHNKDNTYSFQKAKDDFIAQLNSENFGGHTDWRLPSIKELSTLVHSDTVYPSINITYFPETQSSAYWSDTIRSEDSYWAWTLTFSQGYTLYFTLGGKYYVRAVCGEPLITNNLIDNGDGTVNDLETGLMWQQGEGGQMTWEEALNYCETLSLAGYDDWRLPNRNELQSIVDYDAFDPAANNIYFPNVATAPGSPYATSTAFANGDDNIWGASFRAGGVGRGTFKWTLHNVRAVRGGTSPN